jgi:hypothetical protein
MSNVENSEAQRITLINLLICKLDLYILRLTPFLTPKCH